MLANNHAPVLLRLSLLFDLSISKSTGANLSRTTSNTYTFAAALTPHAYPFLSPRRCCAPHRAPPVPSRPTSRWPPSLALLRRASRPVHRALSPLRPTFHTPPAPLHGSLTRVDVPTSQRQCPPIVPPLIAPRHARHTRTPTLPLTSVPHACRVAPRHHALRALVLPHVHTAATPSSRLLP
ncbi:hypothetical protein B0H14DRAFT_2736155, partial [Mycena olivaceomarginata]